MKQKIGIHLSYWQESWSDPLLPLIGKAKQAGFEVAEFPLLAPAALDFTELRAELDSQRMAASCGTGLGAETDITSPDPAIRKLGLEHLQACLQGAAALGSPVLVGLTYAPWGVFPVDDRARRREQCIESLKFLGDIAAATGVRLCMEVVNRFEGYLINTVEQGLALLEEVNHPSLALHLDTFHMNIEEEDLPTAIRLAGAHLGHFHCVSNTRKAPGTGHLDWDGIRDALIDINYSGYFVAETFVRPVGEVGSGMYIWRELAPDLTENARETARFIREEVAFDV
ncbi:MAG: sugar phosphate isomerase/epimerase family protein [Chloroflexota bacterium]|nr:sugar phosphate isomerase/epimerase family protein [Chloroflexota bacterium]